MGKKKMFYTTHIIIYSFAKVSIQKQWPSNMANDIHLNMLPINGTIVKIPYNKSKRRVMTLV